MPKTAGVHRRDEGLLRVRRVTGWLVAGAVALTALLAAVTAAFTPGAKSGASTNPSSNRSSNRSSNPSTRSSAVPNSGNTGDQGLQPLPGDSGLGQQRQADTSSGGS